MTRFRVVHRTEYRYGLSMADGFTRAFLLPRSTPTQQVTRAELLVRPEPDELEETIDVFGNRVVQFAVHRAHDALEVETISEVDVHPQPHAAAGAGDVDGRPWEEVVAAAAAARHDLALEVGPFCATSPLLFPAVGAPVSGLSQLTSQAFTPGRGIVRAVQELCHTIFTTFQFDPGFTDVTTPVATVLAARRGVCQDFAHVAVASLRSLGLAARYVSGYIETEPFPGQPKLVGADASHAWCSVWVPTLGWLDFDPTNDEFPPQHHVTVGWGRDYSDVPPVRGVVIGPSTAQQLMVSVDVTRLD